MGDLLRTSIFWLLPLIALFLFIRDDSIKGVSRKTLGLVVLGSS